MAGDLKVKGRTVEEATVKAAAMLDVLPEEVLVEVIDPGSQGFLGLKRRPAIIIARRAEKGPPLQEETDEQSERADIAKGTAPGEEIIIDEQQQCLAGVKDGKVYVQGEGLPAILIKDEHYELYVNDQPVTGEVAIRKNDQVVAKPEVELVEGSWGLHISPDGLQAKLSLKPAYRRTWELKDCAPAARLKLKAELLEEALPVFTEGQLEKELAAREIVYGIDPQAVQEACAATEPLELVIARGSPPQPGEDARVELLFSTDAVTRVEVGDEEKVNYREMVVRASVTIGTLLAVKVPSRPGTAGMAVNGKVIAPPEPADIELLAGKGVEVIDGQRCVALVEGRPQQRRLRGKVIVNVLPVLLHPRDVDLESGNLRFSGSIDVGGNVADTMVVKASQDLEIHGSVTGATISAGGSIIIHNNCIGSSVVAGGTSSIFQTAGPILDDLLENLISLKAAAQQLAKSAGRQLGSAAQVDMGYLFNILIKNKFKKIPLQVTGLREACSELGSMDEEQKLAELAQELHRTFNNPAAIQVLNISILDDYLGKLETIVNYCQGIPQGQGNITLNYSLNSNLQASGQVKILGRGCFNTQIKAGDQVEINGVFRGGNIYAGGNAYLQEVGSPGGARTRLRVASGKQIKVAKVWPNTVLQIGKRINKIDVEREQVLAYLDSEGNLTLGNF